MLLLQILFLTLGRSDLLLDWGLQLEKSSKLVNERAVSAKSEIAEISGTMVRLPRTMTKIWRNNKIVQVIQIPI